MNAKIVTKENTGVFIKSEKEPEMNCVRYSQMLNAIISTIFLILALLINILTMIAHKRSKKEAKNAQNWTKIEKKLLIYALLTFAGHALVSVLLLILSIGILVEFDPLIYSLLSWISVLCTLVMSSWLLLFTCDSFRQQFVKDFCPKFFNRPPNKPLRQ
ncbi:hypothetical protein niasHS_013668 [Heterodera schachtii]|uniref:PGG domain-containing protein n=1 Tax=Heterodera schachtii TaxID=97005 RepID=A0ABD2IGH2_HETSC